MKSMTGYGRGSTINDRFSAAVEIKTVNNRFLDVNTKSNQELSSYEVVIKQQIASRLKRGRVDVMITIFRRDEVNYELNRSLAAGFLSVIQEIKDEFKLKGEPDINQLIRLPGVMLAARDVVSDYLKPYIDQALAKALDEVEMMRGKEGQALANDCLVRLAKLDLLMTRIEDVAAAQPDGYQLRLSKRITELIERMRSEQKIIELDESRLAQEVAYLAERSDINEEIARLRSHTEQFHGILNSDGEHGKRLDFLLQEFNREANTILSKATDLVIKNAALEIKGEIEKMREQVQNIE
ncbi:MAG: YicC/YloC family endoribonuclease [Pyrinomonadaceae bacterium]